MSILIHRQFTPEPKYPVYPPYHTGLYLEDYFHRYALHHGSFARKYIAVSWTTMYCDRHNCSPLQTWLDSLPQSDQYFTVWWKCNGAKHCTCALGVFFIGRHTDRNQQTCACFVCWFADPSASIRTGEAIRCRQGLCVFSQRLESACVFG
jgi:hypothetical protein